MKIMRRALLSGLPALAVAGTAQAAFPDRPIRVIVPYAPGGNVDIVARLLGPGLTARLGQPVVVENRQGAGGGVGADAVVRSRPDGYTLLAGSNGPLTVNPVLQANLTYDPLRDLVPIAMASRVPLALVAKRDLPARSLAELIALSKSRPDGLGFASTGTGTVTHLTLERFKAATGANLLHVPYRGGGAVGADVISGVVDGAVFELNTALPMHRSGDVRILAIASTHRSPQLPEVETFIEGGVPNFTAGSFVGLLAPVGMPQDIMESWRTAMVASIVEPTFRTRIMEAGGEVSAEVEQTSAGFGEFIRGELSRTREAAAATGLTP